MNPCDHHLWLNRRSWWVAFTVLYDGRRQERIRLPLGTRDVVEARARRDRLLEHFRQLPNCELRLRRASK
jgi:hypothetical protein